MTINKWAFFWGLAVYFVLSTIAFASLPNSGSFGFDFFVFLFFIPGSLITLLIVLITNIICDRNKINIKPHISFILIWFLILFQIVFVLFIYNACSQFGDNAQIDGGYFVYEKLLGNNGGEYCGTGVDGATDVSNSDGIAGISFVGYIFLQVFIIIRAYYLAFKNRNKDKLNNKIPKTKLLITTIAFISIISLILYSLVSVSNIETDTDNPLSPVAMELYWGFDGNYDPRVVQEDGKIIIGGDFTNYLGESANRIIRLNSDGSIDTSFNVQEGFDNIVHTITLQDDGKILVGGGFSTYQGVAANRIIRLNSDGSIDTSFNVGNGFNNKYAYITTIAVQDDGKILTGGNFGEYNGVSANRILRFNADGSRDKSFSSKATFNTPIRHITLQSDDKVLVAGGFAGNINYRGIKDRGIIRLNTDGSLDTSFNTKIGTVQNMIEQSDGKIILVGDFDSYKGVPANGIIRINPDGSIDKSFNPQIQYKYNIRTMAIQSDGRILIGGGFDIYSRDFSSSSIPTAKGVIRLNSDGTKDESFSKGDGFEETVRTIKLQADGKILVGGNFDSYQGITAKGTARLNSDGSWDETFITNK